MNQTRARRMPAYLALTIITLVAGLALGATYSLTEARIAEQATMAEQAAMRLALPGADAFTELPLEEGAPVDWLFEAKRGEETIGHVARVTVKGFGGDIEVIAGIDIAGAITGVSAGGSGFAETAGLGAKAKDEAFTAQFIGKRAPTRVIKAGEVRASDTIDAITSATVTSTAVNGGVSAIASYIAKYTGAAPVDALTKATSKGGEGGAQP